MEKEYWLNKWHANDVAFDQERPNELLLEYFRRLDLKPNPRVLVPLCGRSIDMLWLSRQGCSVVGVEFYDDACRQFFNLHDISYRRSVAESFYAYASENITLLAGDFFALNHDLLGDIDAIYDRAALVALPTDMRKPYADKLIELSTKTTSMLLISASYDQELMKGPPFSVNEQEIVQLFGHHFQISKLHDEAVADIPQHLQAKGLQAAHEMVFHLVFNDV